MSRISDLTCLLIMCLFLLPKMAAGSESVYEKSDTLQLGGVSVYGKSKTQRVREGVYTVNAVSVSPSVNKLTTLNDIVDRSAGVRVRRQGGVGSDYDLSINGLSGNSIRYFLDGVPLDVKGSDVNLDNIPLNTVERVELYKGVIPAHLGSDALGGAVNIVTKRRRRSFIDASYGTGSFHTHTADLTGQFFLGKSKIAVRPTFGLNYSKNDYKMRSVEVWDEETERYILTDRNRFHDSYLSLIGQIEAGVNDVSWADAFFVSGSFSKIDKQLQTGAMQNKVYGNAMRHSRAWSVAARYSRQWGPVGTRVMLSHTHDRSETVDTAFRKYSWDGTWLPATGNEINNKARSIRIYERPLTVLNAGADYALASGHTLAFNYMLNRRGNKRSDETDKTFEPSNDVLTKHIVALTYSQSFFQERLQNSFFVKNYINSASIRQKDNFTVTGADKISADATKLYWGGGLGTRYTVVNPLSVKASFEHSVRLPLSRELLGNGTTVYPNLTLSPEESNNVNVGFFGTWRTGTDHLFSYEADGYLRFVDNYIRARVSEREGMMQYFNEPAIHIKGVDLELRYSWRNSLTVEFNGTYCDARNRKKFKSDGNPSATYNNKVPNRPWLYANAGVTYRFRDITNLSDRLSIGASYRYIHWYYLNWEAYGALSSKARIPSQNIVDLSVTYSWMEERYNISLTYDNLFDRLAYDNYMLQKPGRAIYAKLRLYLE